MVDLLQIRSKPWWGLGAAGLLVDPSLPGVASCQVPAPLVVYPMVDALSVKQENGLDVPPYGHWRAEFYTYTYTIPSSNG